MPKQIVSIITLLTISLFPFAACFKKKASSKSLKAPITVYLVRHAEKQKDGTRDPSLTQMGLKRAQNIRRLLSSTPIHGFYATHLKRTQQTIQPTVTAQQAKLHILRASDLKGLYERITQHKSGESVLVSGHSNTVPVLLKKLGIQRKITINDKNGYDDLFIVQWRPNKINSWLHLHVGPKPPHSQVIPPKTVR